MPSCFQRKSESGLHSLVRLGFSIQLIIFYPGKQKQTKEQWKCRESLFIFAADSLQMSISNWASSTKRGGGKQTITTETREGCSSHLKHAEALTCTLLCVRVVVGVVAGRLFARQVRFAGGVGFERTGDSWDVGQAGRRAGQGGRPTLQEELPVVDDSGACRRQWQRKPKLFAQWVSVFLTNKRQIV